MAFGKREEDDRLAAGPLVSHAILRAEPGKNPTMSSSRPFTTTDGLFEALARRLEETRKPEPKPIYTDGLREWWEVRKEKLESGWVIEWESPTAGEDGGHSGEKDKISLQGDNRGEPTLTLSGWTFFESRLVQAIRARYLEVKYQ